MQNIIMLLSDAQGEVIREISENECVTIRYKRDNAPEDGTFKMSATSFAKVNVDELALLVRELDAYEQAVLLSVIPYVGYEDCCVKRRTVAGYVELGANDIAGMCSMSRAKALSSIETLISKDVLYRGRNSKRAQYFVNPWICNRGARVNKTLKIMFKNYKIRSIGGVRWQDVKR